MLTNSKDNTVELSDYTIESLMAEIDVAELAFA
jgi:hypothetical protein